MDIPSLVAEGTAVNLVAAACLTVLIYDHAITLDEEVTQMWPTSFSVAKCLFLANRYIVESMLLFNCIAASRPYLSDNFCVFYLRWLTVATTVATSVVQGILVLRIWALYRRNIWALVTALFFYGGGTVALIGLVIADYVAEDVFLNSSLHSLPGCYATSVPSIIAGFWIGPLVVETVLFLLVVMRVFDWWRDGADAPKIFNLLARDSTVYFFVIFILLLANYLMFELGPPFLSSLLVTPSTTAGCVLGSHMLLNLRSLSFGATQHEGTSLLGTTDVLIASPPQRQPSPLSPSSYRSSFAYSQRRGSPRPTSPSTRPSSRTRPLSGDRTKDIVFRMQTRRVISGHGSESDDDEDFDDGLLHVPVHGQRRDLEGHQLRPWNTTDGSVSSLASGSISRGDQS